MLTIGPHQLSRSAIDELNAERGRGSGVWKWLALIPLIVILVEVYLSIGKTLNPVRLGVICCPQLILGLGVFFLKPHRDVKQVELTYTCERDVLKIKQAENPGRPIDATIPWSDILFASDAETRVRLHLKSGSSVHLHKECFANQLVLDTFLDRLPGQKKIELTASTL